MVITHGLRAPRVRITRWALVVTSLLSLPISLDVATPVSAHADSYYACKSAAYSCVLDGYNATTMNNNWAAKYYGADTKGGIGTPPHNCTLYAAWMLAHNGLANPGHSWGYADQWGRTLAAETNHTPAVGSIAWYEGGAMGHVAYVAQINWTSATVFLVSDNYAGGVNGYTSNGWVPINQPTGYIHLRDQPVVTALVTKRRLPMRP
jgi:surface antigen